MYGISNGQQKSSGGGGGGGATINYTVLKGSIEFSAQTSSTPFFVGSNAANWAVNEVMEMPVLTSNSDLGLVDGYGYTMVVNIDGQAQTFSGTAMDGTSMGLSGVKMLPLQNASLGAFMIYDHCDMSAGYPRPADGSFIAQALGSTPTSAVITAFNGTLKKVEPATITNSAIKVNSAVTMYINSDLVIKGTKDDGILTLTASDEGFVTYEIEILDTPSEGLFEVVNAYVPTIPDVPAGTTDYDELENKPIVNQDLSTSDFTPTINTYYRHTGTTTRDYTNGVIYKAVWKGAVGGTIDFTELATEKYISSALSSLFSYFPAEKTISNESTNVSITGSASPYLFTVTDSAITANNFIRLYPNDEATETWLNEHTLSSIITENNGSFTFKVDTNTLPSTFSIKYIIESLM